MALFPPIVASSMPAFAIGQNTKNSVRIYYTLSNYNSTQKENIKAVHVSVRRQSSNINVLADENQIIQKEALLQQDEDKVLNRYYIDILSSDLKDNGFEADVLYKVQLRFSSLDVQYNALAPFFIDNIQYFSEWSQVCIIKPIIPPVFYIDDFHHSSEDDYGQKDSDQDTFTYNLAEFIGVYKPNKSSESLKYWRLRLLQNSFTESDKAYINDYTIADSGWKEASAFNYTLDETAMSFECSLMYDFSQDHTSNLYKLFFEIQTKNGYTDSKIYSFEFQQINIDAIIGKMLPYVNNEEGYIKLVFQTSESKNGNVAIRRSDSKHNFLNWQDLTNFLLFDRLVDGKLVYYDFTVESGLAYKYIIQRRDPRGRRGTPATSQVIIPEWEHAFLLEDAGNGYIDKVKQLKLKYDFQISSYKTNISENKTDTIGSQYPFIRRNGEMYYRSFPISGTITAYMDNVELFVPKDTLYDNRKDIFVTQYKGQSYQENINKQYDYIYERKFREEVEKFLYNAKPKLYKSTQEGNIFIKIMEVSLTPKAELDRMIYSFSGTAYEIGEASLNTLYDYGFIDIGVFDPQPSWTADRIGQITSFKSDDEPIGNIFKAGQDIIGAGLRPSANSIAKKHKYKKIFNNSILDDFYLDHIKLTIESQPYLIIEDSNGRFRVFDDIDQNGKDPIDFTYPIEYPLYQMESTYNGNNVYLGTLFEINGEQIIVSYPNNIYELKDDNLRLSSSTTIIPAKDTVMSVDYKIHESFKEDLTNIPKRITVEDKVGQVFGKYNTYSKILNEIKNKYTITYTTENERTKNQEVIKQYVESMLSILVDTEPGVVVEVDLKDSNDGSAIQPERLVINETGELNINPEDSSFSIVNFSIKGCSLDLNQMRNRGSISIEQGQTKEEALKKISNALHGDYCILNNVNYTFYKSQWYESEIIDNTFMDVFCPVDAMIFYTIKLRRDYF